MRKMEKGRRKNTKCTKIHLFFFLLLTFKKALKVILGLPIGNFYWEKAKIMPGKNREK